MAAADSWRTPVRRSCISRALPNLRPEWRRPCCFREDGRPVEAASRLVAIVPARSSL
ncbi:hypothetical protein KCP73_12435 [Salmonella enterica subsp. enterica]|nr:hypothetical protein KCP73_12435 [Salmonella enterica subsp. enterica]